MKRALIVVDYQVDFVSGSLGFEQAKALDSIIAKKCEDAILQGIDVFFTLDTHDEHYLEGEEGQHLPIPHCIQGTPGHEIYGSVQGFLLHAKKVFIKHTFPSLELATYFNSHPYDQVELCGLVSNICVLSNAVMVKSALPNAHLLIDATATSSYDLTAHEQALSILRGLHVEIR